MWGVLVVSDGLYASAISCFDWLARCAETQLLDWLDLQFVGWLWMGGSNLNFGTV